MLPTRLTKVGRRMRGYGTGRIENCKLKIRNCKFRDSKSVDYQQFAIFIFQFSIFNPRPAKNRRELFLQIQLVSVLQPSLHFIVDVSKRRDGNSVGDAILLSIATGVDKAPSRLHVF